METKNYLFLFYDNDIALGKTFSDDDIYAVMAGCLEIIDITDGANPQQMRFNAKDEMYFDSIEKLEK